MALALYAAQTCRTLLDLSIKELLAPSQQTGTMDRFPVGGTRASAVSGGGGKVRECPLAKGCRSASGTFPDAHVLPAWVGNVPLSPGGCLGGWLWAAGSHPAEKKGPRAGKEDQIG